MEIKINMLCDTLPSFPREVHNQKIISPDTNYCNFKIK